LIDQAQLIVRQSVRLNYCGQPANACIVEYGVSNTVYAYTSFMSMSCYVAQCYIVGLLTVVFDLSH